MSVLVPKVGMRNIKTAVSVLLCILILQLLKIGHPFYACIAAVITMQNTVESTFKAGLTRMIGTLIGAGFGILFFILSPHNTALIAIGIASVIYCTNLFKVKQSTSIACVVFLAIMTNLTGTTPFLYSGMRVFETFLGIIIAMVVNAFLPSRNNQPTDEQDFDQNFEKNIE